MVHLQWLAFRLLFHFPTFCALVPAKVGLQGKFCIHGLVTHQAGAYSGFSSMKQLGVFLLIPGCHGTC